MSDKIRDLAKFMHDEMTIDPPPGDWDTMLDHAKGGNRTCVGAAGQTGVIAQNILEDPDYLPNLLVEIYRLNETPDEGEDA